MLTRNRYFRTLALHLLFYRLSFNLISFDNFGPAMDDKKNPRFLDAYRSINAFMLVVSIFTPSLIAGYR